MSNSSATTNPVIANTSSVVSNGMLGGSQYEYNIDGQVESMKTGQINKANTLGNKNGNPVTQPTGANSLPKRTPHSELTSYQSEKRLKEYK